MTQKEKQEITKISKEFFSGFEGTFDSINGTGYVIVDPLSAYLNSLGYENKLEQLPACEKHPQVLVMTFRDGSKFIPSGGDLNEIVGSARNWMWL